MMMMMMMLVTKYFNVVRVKTKAARGSKADKDSAKDDG